MRLKEVGFFAELGEGSKPGPSLRESVRDRREKDERKLIAYLKKGVFLFACPELGRDVLDESARLTLIPHILTDGVWVWRGDLRYYVKKYHVELPEDFLFHVRSRLYTPPKKKDLNLDAFFDAFGE